MENQEEIVPNGFNHDEYFESYEDLQVHQIMLKDKSRLKAYHEAIFNMKDQFKDKIVMDVGAGTGILSIFCAQAGAKKVYAVEASKLSKLATDVVRENGYSEIIQVIEQKVEDITLEQVEKVDIIVSEWMGFYLLHEGMLDSVIFARDNFLKENGLLFPNIAKIYIAPCQLPNCYEFWDDVFGVSMKCVGQKLREANSKEPRVFSIDEQNILSEPKLIFWLDLNSVTTEELNSLSSNETVIVCKQNGKCQGFCLWFEVEFPDQFQSFLSTSPSSEPTHWKQTVIVMPRSAEVNALEPIALELKLDRRSEDMRKYNVTLSMLDPDEVEHDLPCECHMTKCIVTKAYIDSKSC